MLTRNCNVDPEIKIPIKTLGASQKDSLLFGFKKVHLHRHENKIIAFTNTYRHRYTPRIPLPTLPSLFTGKKYEREREREREREGGGAVREEHSH